MFVPEHPVCYKTIKITFSHFLEQHPFCIEPLNYPATLTLDTRRPTQPLLFLQFAVAYIFCDVI
jgi:hypothetical protein